MAEKEFILRVRGYVQGVHQQWLVAQIRERTGTTLGINLSIQTRYRYNPDVRSLPAMVPAVMPLLLLMLPAMLTALAVVRELPAAVLQIAWNSANCWPNVMFNLVNRHDNAGWSLTTPLLYLVSVVYVLTPAVAFALVLGGSVRLPTIAVRPSMVPRALRKASFSSVVVRAALIRST